jgi:hypothetical protein
MVRIGTAAKPTGVKAALDFMTTRADLTRCKNAAPLFNPALWRMSTSVA